MSKITSALTRAEQDRQLEWVPTRVIRAPASAVPAASGTILPAPAALLAAATPSVSPTGNGAAVAPAAMPAATRQSLDQAITAVKEQLAQREQHVARLTQQQLQVNAQLTAAVQLQTQLEQNRVILRRQLAELEQSASAVDAERTNWLKQLEALRECEMLAHAVRMAEQDLAVNTTMVAQVTQSQQRVADELMHYRQRGEALQQEVAYLRTRLTQALSVSGPIASGRTEPTRIA